MMRRFFQREDGTATIEFAILFPAFMLILLNSVEAGVLMARSVMLDRAVDIAVRELRLGLPTPPGFEALKAGICARSAIIPDCLNALQVNLQPVPRAAWATLDPALDCRDRGASIDPVTEVDYDVGRNNDVMLMRVCVRVDPVFPAAGLGASLPVDATGAFALVSSAAFVNEPSR